MPTVKRIPPPLGCEHCVDASDGLIERDGECHRAAVKAIIARRRAGSAGRHRFGPTYPEDPVAETGPTPGKATRVNLSAAAAAKGAWKWLVSKVRPAAPDVVGARRKQCEACPHRKLITPAIGGIPTGLSYVGCELCGCQYEAKIQNADESCPAKPPRWVAVPLTVKGK